jgi:hypothetical protein
MTQHTTEQADASEIAAALPSYEQTLLELAQRDAQRAIEHPEEKAARSVALWMADQVADHSRRSHLEPAFARVMQEQAKRIREKVLAMPRVK